jgi:hypothetical protein
MRRESRRQEPLRTTVGSTLQSSSVSTFFGPLKTLLCQLGSMAVNELLHGPAHIGVIEMPESMLSAFLRTPIGEIENAL